MQDMKKLMFKTRNEDETSNRQHVYKYGGRHLWLESRDVSRCFAWHETTRLFPFCRTRPKSYGKCRLPASSATWNHSATSVLPNTAENLRRVPTACVVCNVKPQHAISASRFYILIVIYMQWYAWSIALYFTSHWGKYRSDLKCLREISKYNVQN